MPEFDVLAVGDYCLDLIFTGLDRLPELGVEITSRGFGFTIGGAYNTVLALHRLGVRVTWAADFGSDPLSQIALDQVAADGVDTRYSVRHNRPLRKVTAVASLPQDRAFLAYYDPDPAIPAGMSALARASARVLYLPGLYYGAALDAGLALARARRMQLAMDGNSHAPVTLETPGVRRAIRAAKVFLPNALEARRLTGEPDLERAIARLSELAAVLVVKNGSGGVFGCQRGGEVIHVPGIPVQPLDTTGAGDVFNAGFLAAWLAGADLRTCLRWGVIAGGLSTLGYGAAGYPVREPEVREWLGRL